MEEWRGRDRNECGQIDGDTEREEETLEFDYLKISRKIRGELTVHEESLV